MHNNYRRAQFGLHRLLAGFRQHHNHPTPARLVRNANLLNERDAPVCPANQQGVIPFFYRAFPLSQLGHFLLHRIHNNTLKEEWFYPIDRVARTRRYACEYMRNSEPQMWKHALEEVRRGGSRWWHVTCKLGHHKGKSSTMQLSL